MTAILERSELDQDVEFAINLAAWNPQLHPRDSHGRFRDKWGLPDAAKRLVDRILKTFHPLPARDNDHFQEYADRAAAKVKKTPEQQATLDYLQTPQGWEDVQSTLRVGKSDLPHVRNFDAMKRPLQDDMLLTRVLGPDAFGLPPERIGEVEEWTGKLISDKGLTSMNMGEPYPVKGPHITMSAIVPRGTQAVIPGGSREVMLDRDQPLRIMKVEADGKGGVNMYVVAEPMHGVPGRGPARNLGAPLPSKEHAPAIAATPEEMARRGFGPNGEPPQAVPAPQPVAGGPLPGKDVGGGPMREVGAPPAGHPGSLHRRAAEAAEARIAQDRAAGREPELRDVRLARQHRLLQERAGPKPPPEPLPPIERKRTPVRVAAPEPPKPAPEPEPEAPQLRRLMSEHKVGSVNIRSARGAIENAQRDLDNGDDPHQVANDLRREAERLIDEPPDTGMFGDGKVRNRAEMRASMRREAGRLRNLANKLDGHQDTRDNPEEPGFQEPEANVPAPPTGVGEAPEPATVRPEAPAVPAPAQREVASVGKLGGGEVGVRRQAVLRNQEIARAMPLAEVANEIRELIDKNQGNDVQAEHVRHIANGPLMDEIRDEAKRNFIRGQLEDVARDLDAGRKDKALARIGGIMARGNVRQDGKVGDKVKFDPKIHKLAEGVDANEGDLVQVRRPGAHLAHGPGDRTQLAKALVGPPREPVKKEVPKIGPEPSVGFMDDEFKKLDQPQRDAVENLSQDQRDLYWRRRAAGLNHEGAIHRLGEAPKKRAVPAKRAAKAAAVPQVGSEPSVEFMDEEFKKLDTPSRDAVENLSQDQRDLYWRRRKAGLGHEGAMHGLGAKRPAKKAAPAKRVAKKAVVGTKPSAERRAIPENLDKVPAADVRKLAEEHGLKPRGEDGKFRPVADLRKELNAKAGRPGTAEKKAAKKAAAPAKKAAPARKRAPEPNHVDVRRDLLKLKTDEERRKYLEDLNLNKAQANRLAKALGARQSRGELDTIHANIVKHFEGAKPNPFPGTETLRRGAPQSGGAGKGGTRPGAVLSKPLEKMLVRDLEKIFADENIARPKGRLLKGEMIALINNARRRRQMGHPDMGTTKVGNIVKQARKAAKNANVAPVIGRVRPGAAGPVNSKAVSKIINPPNDPWALRNDAAIRAEARLHGLQVRGADGKLLPIRDLKRDLNARGIRPGQPVPMKKVPIPDDLDKLPAKDVRVIALPNGVPIHGANGKLRPIADVRHDLAKVRDKNKPKPAIPDDWEIGRMLRQKKRDQVLDIAKANSVDLKGVRGNRELIRRMAAKRIALHRAGRKDIWQKDELVNMDLEELRDLVEQNGRKADGAVRADMVRALEGAMKRNMNIPLQPGGEKFKKLNLRELMQMADDNAVHLPWPPLKHDVINALVKAKVPDPNMPISQMDRGQIDKKLAQKGLFAPAKAKIEELRSILRDPEKWTRFTPKIVKNRVILARILRARKLDEAVKAHGIKREETLGGGAMGDTKKLVLNNGEKVVRKSHQNMWGVSARDQTDAEHLAGVITFHMPKSNPTAAVHRVNGNTIYMGWVDGQLGHNLGQAKIDDAVNSEEGKWIGVLDTIIGNADRHGGNWMIGNRTGKPIPIDHGLAWEDVHRGRGFHVNRGPTGEITPPRENNRSPFAHKWIRIRGGDDWRSDIKMSRSQLESFRQKLEDERPQFELLGRGDWLDVSLERLDAIIARASLP